MDFSSAILLGIVQGVTEFLPVSSTGHLILARTIFGIQGGDALAFDAVLHLATTFAVIIYFWGDLWVLLQALLRFLGRQEVDQKSLMLIRALIIGTIPAAALGLLFEDVIGSALRGPLVLAGVLVLGSLFFMFAEYRYHERGRMAHGRAIGASVGLKVGLFQILALIPGFSRSGATIGGGMLLGLTRAEAARFSFLLAIPIILGGGAKKLLELMASNDPIAWPPILVGSAVAFVTGLLAIRFMLAFVRSHSLWPFVWYRIILAGLIVLFVFAA